MFWNIQGNPQSDTVKYSFKSSCVSVSVFCRLSGCPVHSQWLALSTTLVICFSIFQWHKLWSETHLGVCDRPWIVLCTYILLLSRWFWGLIQINCFYLSFFLAPQLEKCTYLYSKNPLWWTTVPALNYSRCNHYFVNDLYCNSSFITHSSCNFNIQPMLISHLKFLTFPTSNDSYRNLDRLVMMDVGKQPFYIIIFQCINNNS